MHDLWVFGYGSLMWRPGFEHEEARAATLHGYRRCFCIASVHHRGSAERPGLVLGLDRGGACRGMAFKVAGNRVRETLAYLRAREQVNGVYREAHVTLDIEGVDGRVTALAYIAERGHPSYLGTLPVVQQARIVRAAAGLSGANLEYLANTLDHMAALGIRERELERVCWLAGRVFVRGNGVGRQARIKGLVAASQGEPVIVRRLRLSARRRFGHRVGMAT